MTKTNNRHGRMRRVALTLAAIAPLFYVAPALGQAATPDPKVTTVSARIVAVSGRQLITDAGTYQLAANVPAEGLQAGQTVRLTIGAAKQTNSIAVVGRGPAAAPDLFGTAETTVRGRVANVDVANRQITLDGKRPPYLVAPTVTLDAAALRGQNVVLTVSDLPVVTAVTR